MVRETLNILQLNTHHSKYTTYMLQQYITTKQVDILLIQEPYARENKIIGFNQANIFQTNGNNPRAGIILTNKNIDACMILQHSDSDLVCVEISCSKLKCIVISAYFDIHRDINLDLEKIEHVLKYFHDSIIVIGLDSNARSKYWFDKQTNKRGKILETFIVDNDLCLINTNSELTTFEGARGNSNIDLTLVNVKATRCGLIRNWTICGETNFSDHNMLTYQLHLQGQDKAGEQTKSFVYLTENGDWNKFLTNLRQQLLKQFLSHNYVNNFELTDGEIEDSMSFLTLQPTIQSTN